MNLGERYRAFEESRTGKALSRLAWSAFTAGIILYLVYEISQIGWREVLASLPATPWFYVIMIPISLCLPIFHTLILRHLWEGRVNLWHLFMASLNKRALDKEILGYSGEMYLYLWARKNVRLPGKEIIHAVKDNVLISSIASIIFAVLLLLLFFLFGQVVFPRSWAESNLLGIVLFAFCSILVMTLISRFRNTIFHFSRKLLLKVFGLHMIRLTIIHGLQLLQWWVVVPEVPILDWMTLLAAQVIIQRIPLIPNRDLIFVGTGLQLSALIHMPASGMAGMLLASAVINKVLHLFYFVVAAGVLRGDPILRESKEEALKEIEED